MRRGASLLATWALALVLVHCSLLVDTGDLSGGATPASDGGGDAIVIGDAAGTDGNTASEGGTDASTSTALGPVWLAYGSVKGQVGVRRWSEDTARWSSELPGPDVSGNLVRWVVPKETPSGSFLAIESSGVTASRLDVFEHGSDGRWTLGFSVPMTTSTRRAFDIEYETTTNAVVVAYADTTPVPKYRRRTAAGWSAEQSAPAGSSNAAQWIELARNPIANELALVYADGALNLEAMVGDGTTWGTPQQLDTGLNTVDFKCFDAAYEGSSGKLLVAWGHAASTADGGYLQEMQYTAHAVGASFDAVSGINGGIPPGPIVLVPEPGTNRIAAAYDEYNCNKSDMPCDDFHTGIWNGSTFVANGSLDLNTTTLYRSRPSSMPVGAAWLASTGVAVTAYHRDLAASTDLLPYARFANDAWGPITGAMAPPALPARDSMQLVSAPGATVVALVEDTAGVLWAKGYTEPGGIGVWSDVAGGAPLASALVTSGGVPFGATHP